MCSASSSTSNASPITTSSIASSNSSGKRDMCTPFCAGSRSTVQSIVGRDQLLGARRSGSGSPSRRRVTPARDRPRRTSGTRGLEVVVEQACASRPSDGRRLLRDSHDRTTDSSRSSSRSPATTCARRSRPSRASRDARAPGRSRRAGGRYVEHDRRRRRGRWPTLLERLGARRADRARSLRADAARGRLARARKRGRRGSASRRRRRLRHGRHGRGGRRADRTRLAELRTLRAAPRRRRAR